MIKQFLNGTSEIYKRITGRIFASVSSLKDKVWMHTNNSKDSIKLYFHVFRYSYDLVFVTDKELGLTICFTEEHIHINVNLLFIGIYVSLDGPLFYWISKAVLMENPGILTIAMFNILGLGDAKNFKSPVRRFCVQLNPTRFEFNLFYDDLGYSNKRGYNYSYWFTKV